MPSPHRNDTGVVSIAPNHYRSKESASLEKEAALQLPFNQIGSRPRRYLLTDMCCECRPRTVANTIKMVGKPCLGTLPETGRQSRSALFLSHLSGKALGVAGIDERALGHEARSPKPSPRLLCHV
jgi:hypothetical protein